MRGCPLTTLPTLSSEFVASGCAAQLCTASTRLAFVGANAALPTATPETGAGFSTCVVVSPVVSTVVVTVSTWSSASVAVWVGTDVVGTPTPAPVTTVGVTTAVCAAGAAEVSAVCAAESPSCKPIARPASRMISVAMAAPVRRAHMTAWLIDLHHCAARDSRYRTGTGAEAVRRRRPMPRDARSPTPPRTSAGTTTATDRHRRCHPGR